MIISKGSIAFNSLRTEDLELVRYWRNHPSITRYMEYREHITPEMQKEWFASINNINNLYFLVSHKGVKIGLINAKNIDWNTKRMGSGIFFWDKKLLNTHIPILSVLIFGELAFMTFDLTTYAKVRRDNKRAIRYNKFIGFELLEHRPSKETDIYTLNRESYLRSSKPLRKAFYRLLGNKSIRLEMEAEDYTTGIAQLLEQNINPEVVSAKETINDLPVYYF